MSIRKTIGGDRLGSGKKMKVDLKSYERSTHNLNHAWRSTMSAGTLVPFLKRPILPGSTFDIELDATALTNPTEGPLFGSYKLQLDLFLIPMRLYIARLHNNESGLGMDMDNVFMPQMSLTTRWQKPTDDTDVNNMQVEPSSLLAYLGVKGAGAPTEQINDYAQVSRWFNAIPYLAYWEIHKQYYANQQEEVGAYINNKFKVEPTLFRWNPGEGKPVTDYTEQGRTDEPSVTINREHGVIQANYPTSKDNVDVGAIKVWISPPEFNRPPEELLNIAEVTSVFEAGNESIGYTTFVKYRIKSKTRGYAIYGFETIPADEITPVVDFYELKNVDKMKREILKHDYETPLSITHASIEPYGEIFKRKGEVQDGEEYQHKATFNQQSLALKTYQNDLFNNWMNTEWIDGENGINNITAVQIVDDKLEIPSLILARKVFNVLNRIALSGGTYDDWLEVTYDHQRVARYESPAYQGGLIKEIEFQEVVSNSASDIDGNEQPLGTLAGRGIVTDGGKGGKVTIKTDEPAYVMGIVSITPRIDYSQGNDWDVNLKTVNELHKPELDQIGFQDLITDQMTWWDTRVNETTTLPEFKSAGKQPAWINYQTDYNKTYGNFAKENNQMWQTLNRRYEWEADEINDKAVRIKDLTSYIDPMKFNHIFSHTSRDAQNFWVQIGMKITARQKMSAKVMPNL